MTANPSDGPALAADVESHLLAEAVIDGLARVPSPEPAPLDHAALWRHSRRRAGDVVDLATARRLREDPVARTVLGRMIAARAMACSPMAYAAADASAATRMIGVYAVELLPPGDDGIAALVIEVPPGAAAPTALRAEWLGASVVLDLPPPQEGLIELFFAPAAPGSAEAVAILGEPTALIALE